MITELGANGKIIELMGNITSKSRKMAKTALRPTGLTFPQFGSLFALQQQTHISQKELAGILYTDTTTIMVVCDSLEKKGYLKRIPAPTDRRVNWLEMTQAGRDALEKAFPLISEVFEPLMLNFSSEETALLLPILERLFHLVCAMENERNNPKR